MHLLNALSTLAIATLAAAAPAPTPVEPQDERWGKFDPLNPQPWEVTGYGNPNCQGDVMWSEKGNGPDCRNVPRQAASYKWKVWQPTEVRTWRNAGACPTPLAHRVFVQGKKVGEGLDDGEVDEGCFDMAMVNGLEIVLP